MSNECWKPSITLNNLATRLPNGADAFELKSFVTQWISWNVSATYTSFLKPAQWAINRTRLPQPNTTEHQNRQTLSKQTRHRIQCPRATSKLVWKLKTIPKNDPALSINRFCKTNKSTLIYFETSSNIPKHTLIRMNVVCPSDSRALLKRSIWSVTSVTVSVSRKTRTWYYSRLKWRCFTRSPSSPCSMTCWG